MTENPPKLLKARQNHTIVFALVLVFIIFVSQPWLDADGLPRQAMLWIGYALTFFGAFGRAYCSAYLGGIKNKRVMRDGPFGVVRNPLYVFSFLGTVGIGLESGMITFFVLIVGAFVWYYPKVVEKEEAFLTHKFGDEYLKYKQEVPRWIPDMKKWSEPESMETRPKFICHTMRDAGIFLLPMPFFTIFAMEHAHHILPVWLTLP